MLYAIVFGIFQIPFPADFRARQIETQSLLTQATSACRTVFLSQVSAFATAYSAG